MPEEISYVPPHIEIEILTDRIRQLEAFIEDLYLVGRLRLSPEWEHRFHQVTRHKHDPAANTSSPAG
jgi:hypothetical protein